jgi:hypothetical protein
MYGSGSACRSPSGRLRRNRWEISRRRGWQAPACCSSIERGEIRGPGFRRAQCGRHVLCLRSRRGAAAAEWRSAGAVFGLFVCVERYFETKPQLGTPSQPSARVNSAVTGRWRTDGAGQPIERAEGRTNTQEAELAARIEVAAHTGAVALAVRLRGCCADRRAWPGKPEGRTCLRGAAGRDQSRVDPLPRRVRRRHLQ